MTTNLVSLLATILLLLSSTSFANDIRINQVGDDFDLDISQDGTDNKIKGMAGATSTASVYGNDAKLDLTQTGNNNTISMYMSQCCTTKRVATLLPHACSQRRAPSRMPTLALACERSLTRAHARR